MDEHTKESVVVSGDIICLEVDSLGMLAIPSMDEPIPESEELVTQLRVVAFNKISDVNFTRCMFRIQLDGGQVRTGELEFLSCLELYSYIFCMFIIRKPQLSMVLLCR
jgi:hypothetical protein